MEGGARFATRPVAPAASAEGAEVVVSEIVLVTSSVERFDVRIWTLA